MAKSSCLIDNDKGVLPYNDFLFTSITASMDGNQYRVIAFGDCEPSDTSDIVNLEVKTIPAITTPP